MKMKMYTPLIKKAMDIAYKAHLGQVDKGGAPYIFHPLHIAERVDTEYEICVALLHDTIEDSDITVEYLLKEGFPHDIVKAVDLLTRKEGMTYREFILKAKTDPIARKIKIEDIKHHLDLSRLPEITTADKDRAKYYKKFLDILLED